VLAITIGNPYKAASSLRHPFLFNSALLKLAGTLLEQQLKETPVDK
jgi:hypothetical protein